MWLLGLKLRTSGRAGYLYSFPAYETCSLDSFSTCNAMSPIILLLHVRHEMYSFYITVICQDCSKKVFNFFFTLKDKIAGYNIPVWRMPLFLQYFQYIITNHLPLLRPVNFLLKTIPHSQWLMTQWYPSRKYYGHFPKTVQPLTAHTKKKTYPIATGNCGSHSSSKKFVLATDGKHYRNLQLVKMQRSPSHSVNI